MPAPSPLTAEQEEEVVSWWEQRLSSGWNDARVVFENDAFAIESAQTGRARAQAALIRCRERYAEGYPSYLRRLVGELPQKWAQDLAIALAKPVAEPQPWLPPLSSCHLECDRRPQWQQAVGALGKNTCQVVLIVGAAEEAHDLFVQRIQKRYTGAAPGPLFYSVRWSTIPETRADYLACLVTALRTGSLAEEQVLANALRKLGRDRRLVIDHPVVSAEDPSLPFLASYYRQQLPAVLRAGPDEPTWPKGAPIFIQPIEWSRSAWNRLGLPWGTKALALKLLTQPAAPETPPVQLRELELITEEDVSAWLQGEPLRLLAPEAARRAKLIARGKRSATILHELQNLPDLQKLGGTEDR